MYLQTWQLSFATHPFQSMQLATEPAYMVVNGTNNGTCCCMACKQLSKRMHLLSCVSILHTCSVLTLVLSTSLYSVSIISNCRFSLAILDSSSRFYETIYYYSHNKHTLDSMSCLNYVAAVSEVSGKLTSF